MAESSLESPSSQRGDEYHHTGPGITKRKSSAYLIFHSLATMVGGLSSVCIKQLLLPIQVSLLAPTNTNTAFTLVASLGALAGLIASPLTGALSDRTTLRWGRRRPWIIFGLLTAVCGMLLMAGAATLPALLLGEILEQVGVDTLLSTVTALLPDQVPQTQRALLSAFIGIAPNVGGVLGLLLVTRFTDPQRVAQGYELLAALSFVCVLCFLIVLRERPLARAHLPTFRWRRFLLDFVRPLAQPDFAYTLLSRGLVYLSFTMLNSYLLFYLRQGLHFATPRAAQGVTMFQICSTGVLLLVAVVTGLVSQRWDRLKPFVSGGAVLMASGLGIMAFVPVWSALLVAAVLFGVGFGLYLGVDINLAVRVLSSEHARGKDLGIMYTAIFFPLILSTLIGGPVLDLSHENFALLLSIAAASSLCAALVIIPIKAVR